MNMSDCKNMIHLRIKDNFKNVYMYDGETKKSFFLNPVKYLYRIYFYVHGVEGGGKH